MWKEQMSESRNDVMFIVPAPEPNAGYIKNYLTHMSPISSFLIPLFKNIPDIFWVLHIIFIDSCACVHVCSNSEHLCVKQEDVKCLLHGLTEV